MWMHCCKIPPSSLSRSMSRTFSAPLSLAATAAAIPAGPPPITTTCQLSMTARLLRRRRVASRLPSGGTAALCGAGQDVGTGTVLHDPRLPDTQLPGKNLQHLGPAESPLAPAQNPYVPKFS